MFTGEKRELGHEWWNLGLTKVDINDSVLREKID